LSRLWDVALMTVRWLLWLAWNLYISNVLVSSRLVLKTVHGTFIRRQVTSVVQAVNTIRLTIVFRLLRRVSSDAASSRRSSTGLAPRTNSVPSWESTGIAASTADWRSALLWGWAETVRNIFSFVVNADIEWCYWTVEITALSLSCSDLNKN